MIESEEFSVSQSRKSTLLVSAILAGIAGWQYYQQRPSIGLATAVWSGLIAVLALSPVTAVWFNQRWMRLAAGLGYLNSRLILSVLYYLVMTPLGFAVRLLGHDPLTRRQGRRDTYWYRRQHTRQSREGFERGY